MVVYSEVVVMGCLPLFVVIFMYLRWKNLGGGDSCWWPRVVEAIVVVVVGVAVI